mmetsp:Transcript_3144/g.4946  ORF Transcript_3144/g.4946 Transcript_3144/m.4946 type:complete len:276 (+) Transcript_3144:327-1154(+)
MLSQTGEHGGNTSKKASVTKLYRNILANEGVIGLWAGNGANLLRVFPAKGVVFASNDYYRLLLRKQFMNGNIDGPMPTYLSFISGGLSGITASACTYPLDLVRGRISGKIAAPNANIKYQGVWNTIVLTIQHEGFFALYKGVTPTLIGAIPYEGIKFGTVGLCERLFPPSEDGSKNNKVVRKLVFGGLGGVMAGLITYPNDTVRRLLQLQGSHGMSTRDIDVYSGYWDCVRKTYAKHGVGRFYHGVGINLVRMAPNTAVQFGSYELLKRMTEGYI